MSRVAMVTRTITATKVVALTVDVTNGTTADLELTISGTFAEDEKGNAKLLKAVQKINDTDTLKTVSIKSRENVETLYGMTEQKFMENAEVLPPRAVKTEL